MLTGEEGPRRPLRPRRPLADVLRPASGHGLLVQFQTNTLWAYDPDKPAWTKLTPEGDPMPTGNKRLAYFDPAHNVFVVIRDTVWAYRYRKANDDVDCRWTKA